MLIVPLIIEKIYRHQILAKFTSSGFWRALYKIDFMRRYLHRVAGKKLMKVFGGRLRFLGIGGCEAGRRRREVPARSPFSVRYRLWFDGDGTLLAGAAPSQVRLGSTGPAAPGVELRLENVQSRTRQGEIVAKNAERH